MVTLLKSFEKIYQSINQLKNTVTKTEKKYTIDSGLKWHVLRKKVGQYMFKEDT